MKKKAENKLIIKKDHSLNFRLREDVFNKIKQWSEEDGLTVAAVIKPWIMSGYNARLKQNRSSEEEESKGNGKK